MPLIADRRPTYNNVDENDRVLFDDTRSAIMERGLPPGECLALNRLERVAKSSSIRRKPAWGLSPAVDFAPA